MRYHPWRDLRDREHVIVDWRAMPTGMHGATNGEDIIWMERDQLQVQRRCTLAHEIVHLDMGHTQCQDAATELFVRRVTARRLLSIKQLIPVALWTQSAEEAADELWVTPAVLADFVDALTPDELHDIESTVRELKG